MMTVSLFLICIFIFFFYFYLHSSCKYIGFIERLHIPKLIFEKELKTINIFCLLEILEEFSPNDVTYQTIQFCSLNTCIFYLSTYRPLLTSYLLSRSLACRVSIVSIIKRLSLKSPVLRWVCIPKIIFCLFAEKKKHVPLVWNFFF